MLPSRRKSLSVSRDSIRSDENDLRLPQPPSIPFHGDAIARESEDDVRLIQVAVRCRPRKRRRQETTGSRYSGWRHNGATSASSSDDSDDSSSSSDDAPSSSSVIKYSVSRQGRSSSSSSTRPCLYVQAHKQAGSDGVKRRFEFDFVLPPWKTQIEVYNECVASEIAHVLATHQRHDQQPAHATIVAYGQTGTGKTFTMGMLSNFHDDQSRGIIPRALEQILAYAAHSNAPAERHDAKGREGGDGRPLRCIVSMSFLQIYLETVQDLLVFPSDTAFDSTTTLPRRRNHQHHHHHANADLQVRQRHNQTFYVAGLSEYEVRSISDARILLETAARNRTLASTARNRTSSRSHTLLTISLKKARRNVVDSDSENDSSDYDNSEELRAEEEETTSTVSFVDLAGSERIESTLHFMRSTRKRQELRIREAKFINKSLSALGSVIAALAEPKRRQANPARPGTLIGNTSRSRYTRNPKQQQQQSQSQSKHIRFRDSQLTKLLQGRLMQGKSRLLLIATIDDRLANLNETLSTLKFAAQCRRVELQSPRSKAARRKESLLQQVFQEMKTTYEERERALHQKYQTRIKELEDQLHECKTSAVASTSCGMGGAQQSMTMQRASYLALCSLADQAEAATYCDQLQSPINTNKHPPIESFKNDKDMITYVAGLYRQLQTALPKSVKSIDRQSTYTQEKKTSCAHSPVQQQHLERTISPSSPVATAPLREPSHVLPTKAAKIKLSPVETRDAVKVPAPEFHVNAVGESSSEEDTEYQAIVEYLRSTGALDGLVVSDQDPEPFSQI